MYIQRTKTCVQSVPAENLKLRAPKGNRWRRLRRGAAELNTARSSNVLRDMVCPLTPIFKKTKRNVCFCGHWSDDALLVVLVHVRRVPVSCAIDIIVMIPLGISIDTAVSNTSSSAAVCTRTANIHQQKTWRRRE